jgi:hypothetical protein
MAPDRRWCALPRVMSHLLHKHSMLHAVLQVKEFCSRADSPRTGSHIRKSVNGTGSTKKPEKLHYY